jgi:hypothetical protein
MITRRSLGLLVLVMWLGGCCASELSTPPEPRAAAIPGITFRSAGLDQLHPVDRADAARVMARSHERLIEELLTLARQPPTDEYHSGREHAVRLLGVLRAASAAEFLIKNLTWEVRVYGSGSMLEEYPCAVALLEIGAPALEAVQTRRWADAPALERKIAGFIIRELLGPEAGFAWLSATSAKLDGSWKRDLDSLAPYVRENDENFRGG